jgi:hypothetical protein
VKRSPSVLSAYGTRIAHLVLILIGLFLIYVIGVLVRRQQGIAVVIRNDSGEVLRQVSVKVETSGDGGKRSSLYYLAPSSRVRVYVQPVTESHINLEFMDARNKVHTETVVGYVEAGYCGSAKATIFPGERVEAISELACWKSWFDFIS